MRARWIAVVMATALAVASCSSSSGAKKPTGTSGGSATSGTQKSFPAVNEPGVTPTEIRVSGVTATTNPIGVLYGTAYDGVQAYFDMINSQGGIYGRKLVIVKRHDDNLSNNQREVQAMLAQDNIFAALPMHTILFTGAPLLAQANVPTFGWNIQTDWIGPPNFFPQVGALCIGGDCPGVQVPIMVQRLHKTKVAILAYNVAQSADCAAGLQASFNKFPTAKIAYFTKALSFGVTDVSADVKKMVDAGVDFVTTCMDSNGVLTLAREMRQQGLNAIQYLPNGYDHDFVAKNGGFFEGSIVQVQEAPLETKPAFPALRDFMTWMDKGGYKKTENAEIGWVNAAEFVHGLRLAGPDFTRQKLIDALNKLTDYDADGMIPPVNWTQQHTNKHYPLSCQALVQIKNSQFVPIFSSPGKPFLCYENANPATVAEAKSFNRQ